MSEYREALQHPQIAFKSTDLKNGEVKQTPLGLPLLVSGGFALTACVTTLANSRTHHLRNTCPLPQRPSAKVCKLYLEQRNLNSSFAWVKELRLWCGKYNNSLRIWRLRHRGLITLLCLFVFSLLITILRLM